MSRLADAFRYITLAPRLRRSAITVAAPGFLSAQRMCGLPDPSQADGVLLCNFDHEHTGRHSWEAI